MEDVKEGVKEGMKEGVNILVLEPQSVTSQVISVASQVVSPPVLVSVPFHPTQKPKVFADCHPGSGVGGVIGGGVGGLIGGTVNGLLGGLKGGYL